MIINYVILNSSSRKNVKNVLHERINIYLLYSRLIYRELEGYNKHVFFSNFKTYLGIRIISYFQSRKESRFDNA